MKAPVGVIHGRFQMLHKGHIEYLLAGKERCEHLIIGISNPDVSVIRYSEANPHRSDARANPLNYLERLQMIRGAMLEYGVKDEEFDIVPFPINCPELLESYVPQDAVFFMTIYDQWSLDKKAALERLGYKSEVMWERNDSDKFTSGTKVRERIIAGEDWQDLVPDFVYRYMQEHQIDRRLREQWGTTK